MRTRVLFDTYRPGGDKIGGIVTFDAGGGGSAVIKPQRESNIYERDLGQTPANHQPHRFSTWAPMAMAKIDHFHATLEERSIIVHMRKRRPDEEIERFRPDQVADLKELARKAARWAKYQLDALRLAEPEVPESMPDRTADNWRPLFAIADAVGGHWPETARRVALLLSGGLEDPSPEVQVLADIAVGGHRLPWPSWPPINPPTRQEASFSCGASPL